MQALKALRDRPLLAFIVLLFVGAVALGLGIGQPTGLTGKDEYLLGLRIPLEMMQRDAWWVPVIDGAPRLKKPPFIYWLGRASFEAFGPSLVAARGITIAFSLVLLGCATWLGKRLAGRWQTGLLAAVILLGISGMASESRRLMLDVPVAALSAAALCCCLAWLDRPSWSRLLSGALLLSLALMTKGPIAVVVFGSGIAAHYLAFADTRRITHSRIPQLVLLIALAAILPAVWYLHVRAHFPAELLAAGQDEMEARRLQLSLDPLIGLCTLALPYSFIALHAAWRRRRATEVRMLTLWLALSLLPFFFFRSFERYLIGSLLPLALIVALAFESESAPAWARRLGSVVPALLALALCVLLWRFDLGGWQPLAVVLVWFVWTWWRPVPKLMPLLVSAMLLWTIGWGIAFPRLGVNAVAPEVVALAHGRDVLMFEGPQPALLPILVKAPLHQTSQIRPDDLKTGSLIALRQVDNGALQTQLAALGVRVHEVGTFATLASSGSGIRFAREQATWADWKQAWRDKSLDGLKTRVVVFEVL